MRLFTKQHIQQGFARIKEKEFNFYFADDSFSFIPVDDLSKEPDWKPMRSSEIRKLSIKCRANNGLDVYADIDGAKNGHLTCENTLKCTYDKLFIHQKSYRIDAVCFRGKLIDRIVQNITIRRKLINGHNPEELSLNTSFLFLGKKCNLSTETMVVSTEEGEIKFESTVFLSFDSPATKEEAFSAYSCFARLVQFMSHRRDVYFDCDTYTAEKESLIQTGSMYLSIVSEKRAGEVSNSISIETIFPIVGELLSFVEKGNIVPLFIPSQKLVTFSDSYILATAWAQMVFKQTYVPVSSFYTVAKYDVLDSRKQKKDKRVSFQEQMSILITDAFPFVSSFTTIAFNFLLANINIQKYTSIDLPERLKKVRNAIAHGSSDPKDYEYTQYDMVLLLCSIYYGILKKKFGLNDALFKLALAELFFDDTEAFAQWKKCHEDN